MAVPAPLPEAAIFNVGITRSAFSRVNENDAVAAYRIFADEIGKKVGYNMRTVVHVYENNEDFARAIRRGLVVLIICGTWDYLSMQVEDVTEIGFMPISGGHATHRWVLLVRADSGIHSLTELRGRRVMGLHNNLATVGWHWSGSLLLEQHLGSPETFFGAAETVDKPSSAILPVFFGKADACIVDDAAFDTMSEMNPQIGRQLVAIATSDPLLSGVLCLNRSGWPSAQARVDARRALAETEREPAGRQILMLFKSDRLDVFEPQKLETLRHLYARSQELQAGDHP